MKKSKIVLATMLVAGLTSGIVGCGNKAGAKGELGGFIKEANVTVITRETGSGTRGAFVELFGIEEKDENGNKTDKTISTAKVTNSTAVMITSVEQDANAIGYISLGALKDSIKALKVDGVEATAENVKNGSYKVARPFNVAVSDDVSDAAKEFISFIMSEEGQAIINEEGYVGIAEAKVYEKTEGVSGKVVIGGSSSVSPVMEKIIEAYKEVNDDIVVELQQSDSSTGMENAKKGTYDIGMASRELKDEEKETLTGISIAMDGVVVIVNKKNEMSDITSEQVKNIYTGSAEKWSDVMK